MKIPRDVSGRRLADVLCRRWQYTKVHQVGSRIILETSNRTQKTTPVILLLLAVNLVGVRSSPPFLRALGLSARSASTGTHGIYTTSFPLAENPISEHGNWENGKTVGLDWADISTIRGRAFGLESGSTGYDDATALLTGRWGPNQTAQATVFTVNQNDNISEEVELRLRSSLSAHRATGYEINFRCSKTKNAYTEIVRWNGPLGSFTYLIQQQGARYGVANGDVVKATIVGNVITAYINGVQVAQATDSTYATGRPGMGFFLRATISVNRDYGFTSFMASDRTDRTRTFASLVRQKKSWVNSGSGSLPSE